MAEWKIVQYKVPHKDISGDITYDHGIKTVCTNCGFDKLPYWVAEEYNYCPKCGKKMEADNE